MVPVREGVIHAVSVKQGGGESIELGGWSCLSWMEAPPRKG